MLGDLCLETQRKSKSFMMPLLAAGSSKSTWIWINVSYVVIPNAIVKSASSSKSTRAKHQEHINVLSGMLLMVVAHPRLDIMTKNWKANCWKPGRSLVLQQLQFFIASAQSIIQGSTGQKSFHAIAQLPWMLNVVSVFWKMDMDHPVIFARPIEKNAGVLVCVQIGSR